MEFVHLNSPKTGHLDPLFHTFTDLTRMHSNRMRIVRSSSRLLGGCVPGPGGVCTWPGGVPGPRGGVPGPRGCIWSQGVYLVPGGVSGPRGVPAQVLPPVDRHTRVKT